MGPKDHILKVLWHYLNFWRKYKHLKKRGTNRGTHNGSPMTFLMYCVDPKDNILKVSWHYLLFCLKYNHLKNQGYKQGYKQGYAQWVTHDILDVLVRPQGSCPENFVALSPFLAEI